MKATVTAVGWIAAGLLTLAARPVLAKEPARSMEALDDRLKPGSEVDVVDREGRVLRGEFVRADTEGVLISVFGAAQGRRVAAADVATVLRKGDSIRNGTLIGAGIGLGFGLLTYADTGANNFEPICEGTDCAAYIAFSTALYAGIGALADHLIKGREIVYRAPAERLSWSVTPYPVSRGAGVRLAVQF